MPKIPEEQREEANLSEVVESLKNNDLDFGDTKEEFLAAGQRAYDKMNPDHDHGTDEISGLQIGESDQQHVEELHPNAADDSIEAYQWGEGEQAETFVLEDTHGMEDEDNAYRSRKIISDNAEYHLVQEKVDGDTDLTDVEDMDYTNRNNVSENADYHLVQAEVDGDTYVELEVKGEPMFGVNNQNDFEEKWQKLKGNDSEIATPSALGDAEYAGSSEYFRE